MFVRRQLLVEYRPMQIFNVLFSRYHSGQFIATSHNPEAIRRFSDENTIYLYRKSHLEPTIVRPLNELQVSGDLVGALIRGDVEP